MSKFQCAVLVAMLAISLPATAAYTLQPFQSIAVGSTSRAVAVGDVDGDGRDDVVLATGFRFDPDNDYSVFVFFQQEDGTLDQPLKYSYRSTIANRVGLALADLDGDGGADIIIGHSTGITILTWNWRRLQAGMRTELYDVSRFIENLAIADVDRDGYPDMVGLGPTGLTVFFGDGRGHVSRTVHRTTPELLRSDLKSADLNADGHDDIVVQSANPDSRPSVYFNDGTDDLAPPLVLDLTASKIFSGVVATPDFDDDGLTDLVAVHHSNELAAFRQESAGHFAPSAPINSINTGAMQSADLDGDGRDDLVVRSSDQNIRVYLQGSSGLVFAGVYPGLVDSTIVTTQGLAVGDFNGDACSDVAVSSANGGLVMFAGSECVPGVDLAPRIALSPASATLRVENFGPAAANDVTVTMSLFVKQGTLATGSLPTDCTAAIESARRTRLTCVIDTLPAGDNRLLQIPVAIAGGDRRNTLRAEAMTSTPVRDVRPSNDRAVAGIFLNQIP